jgi:hypothetical protein
MLSVVSPSLDALSSHQSSSESEQFELVLDDDADDNLVPWVSVNMEGIESRDITKQTSKESGSLTKHPLFSRASYVQCSVKQGQCLYLPALWYHRVAQRGKTIAVNCWHDQQFNDRYVYYQATRKLAGLD